MCFVLTSFWFTPLVITRAQPLVGGAQAAGVLTQIKQAHAAKAGAPMKKLAIAEVDERIEVHELRRLPRDLLGDHVVQVGGDGVDAERTVCQAASWQ